MSSRDDVRTYYAGYGESELARLTTPAGRLEMALTTALLAASRDRQRPGGQMS